MRRKLIRRTKNEYRRRKDRTCEPNHHAKAVKNASRTETKEILLEVVIA